MNIKKNAAFTLIELLVVVLIIGILAAIAVPQYQTAVDKSRMSQAMILGRAVRDAQQRYYMANGKYTMSFDDLDIDIPGNCTQETSSDADSRSGNFLRCNNYTLALTSTHAVYASIPDVAGLTYSDLSSAGYSTCWAHSSSKRGQRLCESLGCVYYANHANNGNRFYRCN